MNLSKEINTTIYDPISSFSRILGENEGEVIKHIILTLFLVNFCHILYWVRKNGFKPKTNLRYIFPENLFTSLGILGTFIGIVVGLDVGKITVDNMSTLTKGMSTAFVTSIYGLLASMSLGIVRHWINKRVEKDDKKNEIFYLKKIAENSPQEMAEAIKELVPQIRNLSEHVDPDRTATKIAEAVTGSMNPFFKVIDSLALTTLELKDTNQQLANFIQKDLKSIFEALGTSVESSNQSIKETNAALVVTKQSLELQRDNLRSVELTLKEFSVEMKEVLEKQLVDYKEVSRTSINLLESTGFKTNELITNGALKLESSLATIDEVIHKTRETTISELQKFQDQYSQRLEQYLFTQGEHLDKHLRGNAEKLNDTVSRMKEVMDNYVTNNESLIARQDELSDRLLNVAAKAESAKHLQDSIITEANTKMALASSLMQKNVATLTTAYDHTAESLEKINETTKKVVVDFEKAVISNIGEYQKRVDDHISNILNNIWSNTSVIATHAEVLQANLKSKEKV